MAAGATGGVEAAPRKVQTIPMPGPAATGSPYAGCEVPVAPKANRGVSAGETAPLTGGGVPDDQIEEQILTSPPAASVLERPVPQSPDKGNCDDALVS